MTTFTMRGTCASDLQIVTVATASTTRQTSYIRAANRPAIINNFVRSSDIRSFRYCTSCMRETNHTDGICNVCGHKWG